MKRTTPFKEPGDFEKDLIEFSNIHRITLAEHSKRISDYFEMTCYNLIVRYYEKLGYDLSVQNLKGGKFKYKCSPKGLLENFSYFKAEKADESGQSVEVFIFHNATVQSSFDDLVFTTPDIVVSKTKEPSTTTDYYATKLKLSFVSKNDLITFCEVKHYTPFPELMLNFMGTVHELMPDCTEDNVVHPASNHIAPSLLMSGTFGKSTNRIKESLEGRYYVNFIDNLFEDASIRDFLKNSQLLKLASLGKKRENPPAKSKSSSVPDYVLSALEVFDQTNRK